MSALPVFAPQQLRGEERPSPPQGEQHPSPIDYRPPLEYRQRSFLILGRHDELNRIIAAREQSVQAGAVQASAHALPTEERQCLILTLAESLGADAPSIGIVKTPGVVGGSAHLVRSRIPVWTLEAYRRRGLTIEKILENFPTIGRPDVVSAWTYATLHGSEIETDLRENEEEQE